PRDQHLACTALTLGRRYFVGVGLAAGGEPERVGRFEPGVPLHEAARVGQHRDPLRGGEAEVVVAAWANPQFALELARVGQLAAAWALDPEVIGYDRAVLALWFRREARLSAEQFPHDFPPVWRDGGRRAVCDPVEYSTCNAGPEVRAARCCLTGMPLAHYSEGA